MSPHILLPLGRSNTCAITSEGMLTFPHRVIQRLGWTPGCHIALHYLLEPAILLLLFAVPADEPGFTLSPLNRTPTPTGGKLTCRRLAERILRPRIPLPLEGLRPLFLSTAPYQLALLLQPLAWLTADFSAAGLETIKPDLRGVYRLVDGDERVVRIGEGWIASRIREHLKDDRLVQAARLVHYVPVIKDDSPILERVLLAQHEHEHGVLPTFNTRRA